jgi:hypothetical protein
MKKKRGRLPSEKQICPRSSTKTGRQKIPTLCSVAPDRRLAATVAPLPSCPRTAALRLALRPSLSRVSPFTFVLTCAHLPISIDMGTKGIWRELFGNLMRTKGFWWNIDGNRKNLMGAVWGELDGKSSPHPFKKIRNIPWRHVCTTQLAHPLQKIRNIPGGLLVPPNWHNPSKKKLNWRSSHALS